MTDLTETIARMRRIEQQNEMLRGSAWTQSQVVSAPLANILGRSTLLKENFEEGKRDRVSIEHICNSAERLDMIIHEIVRKTDRLDQG